MIELRDIKKSFADVTAVAGLSLKVHAGEVFGLLGPNGAGKTTTISMIVGLLAPDSGQVRLMHDGREHDPFSPVAKSLLGIAPQSIALYDEMTAKENLDFFGSLYNLHGSSLNRRVHDCLTMVGLVDRQHHYVKGYSGGMKRRLNLAAALLHDPPMVLMDEPTAGVDPQSRNALFEVVMQLKKAGKTVVYSTHYMEEAERMCDRIAIIDRGRLLALDTVPNLVRDHGGHSIVRYRPAGADTDQVVETAEPLAVLSSALAAGKLQSANIVAPDLEMVFLKLTGRSLRD